MYYNLIWSCGFDIFLCFKVSQPCEIFMNINKAYLKNKSLHWRYNNGTMLWMRVRLKNISWFARTVQWHEGWGILKLLKRREIEREREREREGYCFVYTLNSGRRIHLLWYEWLSHIWDKLVFSLPCCYSRAARSLELFYDFWEFICLRHDINVACR